MQGAEPTGKPQTASSEPFANTVMGQASVKPSVTPATAAAATSSEAKTKVDAKELARLKKDYEEAESVFAAIKESAVLSAFIEARTLYCNALRINGENSLVDRILKKTSNVIPKSEFEFSTILSNSNFVDISSLNYDRAEMQRISAVDQKQLPVPFATHDSKAAPVPASVAPVASAAVTEKELEKLKKDYEELEMVFSGCKDSQVFEALTTARDTYCVALRRNGDTTNAEILERKIYAMIPFSVQPLDLTRVGVEMRLMGSDARDSKNFNTVDKRIDELRKKFELYESQKKTSNDPKIREKYIAAGIAYENALRDNGDHEGLFLLHRKIAENFHHLNADARAAKSVTAPPVMLPAPSVIFSDFEVDINPSDSFSAFPVTAPVAISSSQPVLSKADAKKIDAKIVELKIDYDDLPQLDVNNPRIIKSYSRIQARLIAAYKQRVNAEDPIEVTPLLKPIKDLPKVEITNEALLEELNYGIRLAFLDKHAEAATIFEDLISDAQQLQNPLKNLLLAELNFNLAIYQFKAIQRSQADYSLESIKKRLVDCCNLNPAYTVRTNELRAEIDENKDQKKSAPPASAGVAVQAEPKNQVKALLVERTRQFLEAIENENILMVQLCVTTFHLLGATKHVESCFKLMIESNEFKKLLSYVQDDINFLQMLAVRDTAIRGQRYFEGTEEYTKIQNYVEQERKKNSILSSVADKLLLQPAKSNTKPAAPLAGTAAMLPFFPTAEGSSGRRKIVCNDNGAVATAAAVLLIPQSQSLSCAKK